MGNKFPKIKIYLPATPEREIDPGDQLKQNLETAPNGISTSWFNCQDESDEGKITKVGR
jgi:hypothetical protein